MDALHGLELPRRGEASPGAAGQYKRCFGGLEDSHMASDKSILPSGGCEPGDAFSPCCIHARSLVWVFPAPFADRAGMAEAVLLRAGSILEVDAPTATCCGWRVSKCSRRQCCCRPVRPTRWRLLTVRDEELETRCSADKTSCTMFYLVEKVGAALRNFVAECHFCKSYYNIRLHFS